MGLSLVLEACSTQFPIQHPYVISIKNQLCGEYTEVSQNPPQFQFLQWHPIAACDGFFALPPADVNADVEWCKLYCPKLKTK